MLALPLIAPQEDHSLYLRTAFRPRPDSPPLSSANAHTQTPHQRQQQQRRDEERKIHNARSPLALLAADEAAIAARKAAIRNFGAYWIRPPGVPKTLQAMHEEEQERVEQEEMARQERGLLDMHAQQQLAETREQAANDAEEEDAVEVDLDEGIPEAEAMADGEVSFNDESLLEGSHLVEQREAEAEAEMEEAELTGAARDEEALGMEHERDLDESIPEAGSYQHTDTEMEDSTSESELQDSFAVQSTRRSARHARPPGQPLQAQIVQGLGGAALQQRMHAHVGGGASLPSSPGSLHLSNSLLESSLMGSSPVLQRNNMGGPRGRGNARRRGRHS